LLEKIFGQSNDKVIQIVSVYCLTTDQNVKQEMEHIASESVRVVRDHVADLTSEDSIAAFVSQHKHEVLLYLPASLQLGSILGNDNLDDRTNKMEGPVSGLMHRIEKQFNSSGNN
jgi:hypothetical protein